MSDPRDSEEFQHRIVRSTAACDQAMASLDDQLFEMGRGTVVDWAIGMLARYSNPTTDEQVMLQLFMYGLSEAGKRLGPRFDAQEAGEDLNPL